MNGLKCIVPSEKNIKSIAHICSPHQTIQKNNHNIYSLMYIHTIIIIKQPTNITKKSHWIYRFIAHADGNSVNIINQTKNTNRLIDYN